MSEQVGIKQVAAVTVVGTVTYDTWTTYFPTYAQTNADVPAAEALTAGPIALAFFAVLQPPAGMLSDRVGRKPLLIVFASGCSRRASCRRCAAARPREQRFRGSAAGAVRRHGAAQQLYRDRRGAGRRAGAGDGCERRDRVPPLADRRVLALFGLVVYLRLLETAHRPLD